MLIFLLVLCIIIFLIFLICNKKKEYIPKSSKINVAKDVSNLLIGQYSISK